METKHLLQLLNNLENQARERAIEPGYHVVLQYFIEQVHAEIEYLGVNTEREFFVRHKGDQE